MPNAQQRKGSTIAALIAAGLALSACVGGEGASPDGGEPNPCPCDSRAEMVALVGSINLDCSNLLLPGEMRACVSEALATRVPFLVEGELHGTESSFLQYLVGNGTSDVFVGTFDADPTGSGACATLDVSRCASFQVLEAPPFPGGSQFNCLESRESFRLCGPAVRF